AERRKERLDDVGIKVAFVTSESLYDHQRRQIEKTFGCPVANGYGGRVAGFIAHECPEGLLHITAVDLIVELLDHEGRAVAAGERSWGDRGDGLGDAGVPIPSLPDRRRGRPGWSSLRVRPGPTDAAGSERAIDGLRRGEGRHRSPWSGADLCRARPAEHPHVH